ncbi:DUF5683 domain-containing protein [Prevotella communis]|uniref:DUF5683 domain-containing protein n=1 Tax=Prevotella communis TaxID=2913614 RepID=UPI001EDAEE1C|nr:DUF5683 domain-containing protein [Prevotella communis]UKK60256.1 DUF5683 domain-containing protein [Prevotella communis]
MNIKKVYRRNERVTKSILFCLLAFLPFTASAQNALPDSIVMAMDSMYEALPLDTAFIEDSLEYQKLTFVKDEAEMKVARDWNTWRPDPQRALWLALVIPGGGQIYNRKYWKLPIVYGGFVGCIYAMMWNNMMYKDYSQAYLDIMDDDPGTASYNKFLHLGKQITPANEERYKQIFKSRKDKYRRWRDLSFFCMLGVYAVSVIDAYVDAELSSFDISKDLSLKVRPTVISNKSSVNPLYATSLGVNCSINF